MGRKARAKHQEWACCPRQPARPGKVAVPLSGDDAAETATKRASWQHLPTIGRKMELSVLPASKVDLESGSTSDRCRGAARRLRAAALTSDSEIG